MAISLPPETRKALTESIRRYSQENLDEEMGDLKAGLFLDYCLEEIGPAIYNKTIQDAQGFFHERITDLENTCYEPEMTYWPRQRHGNTGNDAI